jgi:HSP20 family protein
MSQVAIEKVNDASQKTLPIFGEIAKRFEAIRRRAFGIFEKRGCEGGHDVEDWLEAEREFMGSPAAEVTEKDGAYQVRITLPGFEAKDVEVTATPSEILVHFATKQETKEEKNNILWTEFGSNDVYRRFGVPHPIDVDRVTAKLDNGVLRISAPEIAKPKGVAAKAA